MQSANHQTQTLKEKRGFSAEDLGVLQRERESMCACVCVCVRGCGCVCVWVCVFVSVSVSFGVWDCPSRGRFLRVGVRCCYRRSSSPEILRFSLCRALRWSLKGCYQQPASEVSSPSHLADAMACYPVYEAFLNLKICVYGAST